MRISCSILAALTVLSLPALGRAGSSVRYALVLGNNHGRVSSGPLLPDLKHAESEAQKIREKLVTMGSFSPDRVLLLKGKTHSEILRAARSLAALHRKDRAALGQVATLFAFFYTGHGLKEKLLTADDPLTGQDLATIFKEMGATMTIGVFDACFSGSFDLDTLHAKGIRSTPGFNAFTSLPREVLHSQGTMWFVSSRPDQVSYEDKRLGGVFTHYFIEAMERARSDGIGVTLEDLWEYTRSQTERHTEQSGSPQTPQKMVRNLVTTGPLYFSFPVPRTAWLAFDPSLEGRFIIRYETSQLIEFLEKDRGSELKVAMYPTDVVLQRLERGGSAYQRFSLRKGQTVWVRDRSRWSVSSQLGSREENLRAKGQPFQDLVLAQRVRQWSGLLELGYHAALGPSFSASTTHNLAAGLRLDYGPFFGKLGFSYGRRSDDFTAWGYAANRVEGTVDLGMAVNWRRLRLGLALSAGLLESSVRYRDGTSEAGLGFSLGGNGSVLVAISRKGLPLYGLLGVGAAAERADPIAPPRAASEWSAICSLGAGLAVELF